MGDAASALTCAGVDIADGTISHLYNIKYNSVSSFLAKAAAPVLLRQLELPMNIINFSEARNNLKDVIDRVVNDADVTVITRRDAPDAVVMSLDAYNSLLETVHLLSSPANATHLARSLSQLRAGEAKERELISSARKDGDNDSADADIH